MLTQPNLKHTFLFPTKPTHLISLVERHPQSPREILIVLDKQRHPRLNRILIHLWFWQLGLIVHIDRSP